MKSHVRVGVMHCDVEHLKGICNSHMEGRAYYPIVKVYGAPGVHRIVDLEQLQPQLPSGTIMKLVAAVVTVIASSRGPEAHASSLASSSQPQNEPLQPRMLVGIQLRANCWSLWLIEAM